MATNFYDDGFSESVDSEKLKLLKLLADHGAEGAAIYDEARDRQAAQPAANTAAATAGTTQVPETAIAQTQADFDRRNRLFGQILRDAQDQQEVDMRNRMAAETIYKDAVSGDYTLRMAADQDIADAAAAGRAGGGGGRGGRGRGGLGGLGGFAGGIGGATIPASYFEDQLNRNNLGFEPGLGDPSDPGYYRPKVIKPVVASGKINGRQVTAGSVAHNLVDPIVSGFRSMSGGFGMGRGGGAQGRRKTSTLPAGTTLAALSKAAGSKKVSKVKK